MNTEDTEIALGALDGSNPIGYLAALGVLRVLHDAGLTARLRWVNSYVWRPVILGVDRSRLLETLLTDVQAWKLDPEELSLRYAKEKKGGREEVEELKPPPDQFQAFASDSAEACREQGRRWADYVAAFAAAHEHLGTDNSGATKPTALHLTAGNQQFLRMVSSIIATVEREELDEALFGPWRYQGKTPVLNWDLVAGERNYALRATNPAGQKKLGVPGADWLAFRGLAAFPVVLQGQRAVTTGFEGRGKKYRFHWALWSDALDYKTACSVVSTRWDKKSIPERDARGIGLVLTSIVRRTDQGGYGSFSAPAPT